MLVELSPNWDGRDKRVTYMECFGRLMAGIAPWLSLPDDDTPEGAQRRQLREWALASYRNAVDPDSPDYLLWRGQGQALVDADDYWWWADALYMVMPVMTKMYRLTGQRNSPVRLRSAMGHQQRLSEQTEVSTRRRQGMALSCHHRRPTGPDGGIYPTDWRESHSRTSGGPEIRHQFRYGCLPACRL